MSAKHHIPDEPSDPAGQPTEVERVVLQAAVGRIRRTSAPVLLTRNARSVVYKLRGADRRWRVVKIVASEWAEWAEWVTDQLSGVPGVNPLVTSGSVEDHGYLVYDFAPRTLPDRIEQAAHGRSGSSLGGVMVDETVQLLMAVAQGLDRFAQIGLVHADVKPSNVLITAAGSSVITDLERVLTAGSIARHITPGFASRQLLTGARAGPADDRYGFAATVAATLCGDMAWADQPRAELTRRLGVLAPPLLNNLDPEPAERSLTSVELLQTLGRARAAADAIARAPKSRSWVGSGPAPSAGHRRMDAPGNAELATAALLVWGPTDLRASTVERAGLALSAIESTSAIEADRPIWRRPATLTSIGLTLFAVAIGVWLTVF